MTSSVRISQSTRRLLAELAVQQGTSLTSMLDKAVEHYRRQYLLAASAAAYEELEKDPAVSIYHEELLSLDGTASDGLEPYHA